MTDLPIPEGDLTAAESEELLLLCGHAPGPEPLSPAAQAVLDAVLQKSNLSPTVSIAAAALRAAADHIDDASDGLECQDILLQIADELEGT